MTMYLDHFGLTEPPFRITPHTDFFFPGANRGATLEALIYAIVHDEGITKVSGEVGSGKTMLCRVLAERLPPQIGIVYLSNPSLSRDDILYAIADELAIPLPANTRASTVLRLLQAHLIERYASGQRVAVLIDEAHAMPAESLEEIRLLSNLESNRHKLLQLVLFGQPELNEILARSDMRQLKERITHNFHLEPLVRDDIAAYLEFRMRAAGYKGPNVFSPAATRLIAEASQGLTRRINILADKSLLSAFSAGSHQITAREVRAAIRDSEFSNTTRASRHATSRIATALSITAALAVALWIATHSLLPASTSPPATNMAPPSPPPAPAASVATVKPGMSPMPAPPPSEPAPPSATPVIPAAKPDPAASLLEQHLATGKEWLAKSSDEHWFLQLMTAEASRSNDVEYFLRNLKRNGVDMQQVRLYRSDLSGHLRYGVIYGDFPSAASAQQALATLPAFLKTKKPFPRQVIRLR
ncbi:MAG: AAA family ATPase [Proteobacteria bacterium]|nr:AAA family ATPase [Pseudomonadota bacterium]HQR03735.1 AAA family ATPase [Rhodocyclaceae bacterium]